MAISLQAKVRECKLDGCKKCANRAERSHNSEDGICTQNVSLFDGVPIRCVGEWANEKTHYLSRYFQIFATGMKDKWDGHLRYVEVCSGPGRCSTRDGYEQDGTSLAILNNEAVRYISDSVFIDCNRVAVNALQSRIDSLSLSHKARATVADYNAPASIRRALTERPFKGLAFCLIDPTSCDIPFETVKTIAASAGGKCDLLISFFSNVDFKRNAVNAALANSFDDARQKYTRFLGCPDFFERKEVTDAAKANKSVQLAHIFRAAYAESLAKLDYICADPVPVSDYYHLLFASKHAKGLEFWKKATKVAPNGGQELF